MNLMAVFSEEGMELLDKGTVCISAGGLRFTDGPKKGCIYELADFVLQNEEDANPEMKNTIAAALEKVSAQYKTLKKDTAKSLNDLNRAAFNSQLLGGVNVALSFANTAISVAGFVVVYHKLGELETDIKQIDAKIDEIYHDIMSSHQKERFQNYLIRMHNDLSAFKDYHTENAQTEYYQRNDQSIPNLLGDVSCFLEQVREWFTDSKITAEKGALGCEILFSLLPLYSNEIIEACQCHVHLHGKMPGQYPLWLEPLAALSEEPFQTGLKQFLIYKNPSLSPLQKASLYNTMNVVLSNILKAQINNGKICEYMASENVTTFDELKIQAISVKDFEKGFSLTSAS